MGMGQHMMRDNSYIKFVKVLKPRLYFCPISWGKSFSTLQVRLPYTTSATGEPE